MPKKLSIPLLAPRTVTSTARILHTAMPMPVGDALLVTEWQGVWLMDPATGAPLRWYRKWPDLHPSVCHEAAVTEDGETVAAGFGDRTLARWRGSGEVKVETPLIPARVSLTSDGSTLATSQAYSRLSVHDAGTLALRWEVNFKKSFANSARIDPTGSHVATGGTDGILRILDAGTGAVQATAADNGWITDLDTRAGRIAVGGRARQVRIHDPAGTLLRVLDFGRSVEWVSLSHDGLRCVASGGGGAPALVWDTATGAPIGRLDLGKGAVAARFCRVPLGPGGYRVAAVCEKQAGTWDVP